MMISFFETRRQRRLALLKRKLERELKAAGLTRQQATTAAIIALDVLANTV